MRSVDPGVGNRTGVQRFSPIGWVFTIGRGRQRKAKRPRMHAADWLHLKGSRINIHLHRLFYGRSRGFLERYSSIPVYSRPFRRLGYAVSGIFPSVSVLAMVVMGSWLGPGENDGAGAENEQTPNWGFHKWKV